MVTLSGPGQPRGSLSANEALASMAGIHSSLRRSDDVQPWDEHQARTVSWIQRPQHPRRRSPRFRSASKDYEAQPIDPSSRSDIRLDEVGSSHDALVLGAIVSLWVHNSALDAAKQRPAQDLYPESLQRIHKACPKPRPRQKNGGEYCEAGGSASHGPHTSPSRGTSSAFASMGLPHHPDNRKRKRRDESPDDQRNNNNSPPPPPTPPTSASSARVLSRAPFACPFSYTTLHCFKGLTRIVDVRQHLFRKHMAPHHCPICGATFEADPDDTRLNAHIGLQRCQPRNHGTIGVTPDQRDEIVRRAKHDAGRTDWDRWYLIWDILFPHDKTGVNRPATPYVDGSEFVRKIRVLVQEFRESTTTSAMVRELLPDAAALPPGAENAHRELHQNLDRHIGLFLHWLEARDAQGWGND
jgi:hypothetical protein